MTYTVRAPAKINIGLRVLSKRKDGYHNIETIFYPVKLYDTIRLSIRIRSQAGAMARDRVRLTTNSKELKNIKQNICQIAANSFFKNFKIPEEYEVKIYIKKNIPIGAGLGGGSSDAAAVLKLLCRHFKMDAKK